VVLGSLIAPAIFGRYGVPILRSLFTRAGQHVALGLTSGSYQDVADGAAVIAVEGTLLVIFVCLMIAKHSPTPRQAINGAARSVRRA
jgi:hypothetical protein